MTFFDHRNGGAQRHAHILGDEGDGAPADSKKKHHDNLIIIAVSIAGLILTYLIYRSRSSASATTTTGSASTGTVAGSSGSSTTATDPTAEAGVSSLTTALQQESAQEQSDNSANQSAISGLQAMIQNLGAELTSLEATPAPTVSEGGSPGGTTGSTGSTPPPVSDVGLFGGTPIVGGSLGQQSSAAMPYDVGQEVIGGNPYTDFAFPAGTSLQQIATDLYSSWGPNGPFPNATPQAALAQVQAIDPTGSDTLAVPLYGGEPVISGAPVAAAAVRQPAASPNVKAA